MDIVEKKQVTIVSGVNLDQEISKIKSETFSNMNAARLIDKHFEIIRILDSSIQNDMDNVSMELAKINKVKKNPEVMGHNWSTSEDPWYEISGYYDTVKNCAESIVSWKDWQIEFLKLLLNKCLDVIANTQEAGAEEIRFRTSSELIKDVKQAYSDMAKQQQEANMIVMKQMADMNSSLADKLVGRKTPVLSPVKPEEQEPEEEIHEPAETAEIGEKSKSLLEKARQEGMYLIEKAVADNSGITIFEIARQKFMRKLKKHEPKAHRILLNEFREHVRRMKNE
jgi:hypothetical protein